MRLCTLRSYSRFYKCQVISESRFRQYVSTMEWVHIRVVDGVGMARGSTPFGLGPDMAIFTPSV